jgi:isopenicillin N synthase-like dioxygenase
MSINNTNNAAPETGIPIVDFSKFLNGEKEEKEFVARQIDDAFRNAGFVYLKGHGVPKETVEECFEWVIISRLFLS